MRVSAVILARVIWFLEVVDLNPRGTVFYPNIVRALVERYGFQKSPQKVEDFDETKGVTFEQGTTNQLNIDKLVIYTDGIQLDTASSTEDSDRILEEALRWATQSLGLKFNADMVKRKAYVSQFTFYSDAPILQIHPVLQSISAKVGETVSENLRLPSLFEPIGILWGLDPEAQRMPVFSFSIERRQGKPFSEGKYFSAAPLPTDTHMGLVEEFEKTALQQKRH